MERRTIDFDSQRTAQESADISPVPADALGPQPAPQKRYCVLVAEDNPTNRAVALAQLRKLGYDAQVAINGAEAVEALLHRSFDLILMDCEMPTMDGYEATRRIRASPQSRIPIIAVTAQTMFENRDRCVRAGMDDFLPKPVDMKRLGAMLAKWSSPIPSPAP